MINGFITQGIGLMIYGALIIGTVDNFLKPKIIGDRAKIHPALVLLGVVGGIQVFGFIGLFLGPILFASFNTIIKIYNVSQEVELEQENKEMNNKSKSKRKNNKKKVIKNKNSESSTNNASNGKNDK